MLLSLLVGAFWSAKALALGSLSTLPYDPGTTWDNPGGLGLFNRLDGIYARSLDPDTQSLTLILPAPSFNTQLFLAKESQRWEYGLGLGKRLFSWLSGGALVGYSHRGQEHEIPLSVGACPEMGFRGLGRVGLGAMFSDLLGEPETGLSVSLVTDYSFPYLVVVDFRQPWGENFWRLRAGADASFSLNSLLDISLRGGYINDPYSDTSALLWGVGLGMPFASLDMGARGLDFYLISVELFLR